MQPLNNNEEIIKENKLEKSSIRNLIVKLNEESLSYKAYGFNLDMTEIPCSQLLTNKMKIYERTKCCFGKKMSYTNNELVCSIGDYSYWDGAGKIFENDYCQWKQLKKYTVYNYIYKSTNSIINSILNKTQKFGFLKLNQ